MTDDKLHQLERGYTLMWRDGRVEDAVRALGDDFEWIVPDHPEGAVRHGPEGVIEFVREWIEPWERHEVEWRLEPGTGDHVLASIEMTGRGRDSGVPTGMTFWQVWTFRDGRAVRMRLYWDEDEARRAAGLAGP
jgi:ketosteroid isomerase-like protein